MNQQSSPVGEPAGAAAPAGGEPAARSGRDSGRRSWHRRASRPVTVWLVLLVIAGLIHPVIPEYRWVLIHLFTLGAVTNSIVLWSQHFTEKFLGQRLPDAARPRQLLRIRLLNAGIVLTLLGQTTGGVWERSWLLTQAGAAVISVLLLWHAVALAGQFFRAERARRFRAAVLAYVASALCLPVGAVFGAVLAMGPGAGWQERLLLGHLVVNVLGFIGLAAVGSLAVLFPTIWRTRAGRDRTAGAVALLLAGLIATTVGALLDHGTIAGAGLLVYVVGWILAALPWVGNVLAVCRDPRDRISFAAVSVAMAPLWLIGTLLQLAVRALLAGEQLAQVPLPSIPLLVGFAAQLLIGVMSQLLPATIGGGAGAVRTAMVELNRAALFRATVVNLGLAIWLASDYSWLKVVMSVLSIGALVAFLPLVARGVRAQVKVLRRQREPVPAPAEPRPATGQITAAIAVVALILALFGGLHGPGSPGPTDTAVSTGAGDENVTEVTVVAGDLVFEPAQVSVPAGNRLLITLRNEDTIAHDLRLENGVRSGRLVPGQEMRLDAGIITADVNGWCTIAGHHAQGMTFDVLVATPTDAGPETTDTR